MGLVRILPDSVVNKIAAGEVVERPASVARELVENAIDAGATDIRVEVRGGGGHLVRVRDDGCGMSAEDAGRALERHSTSKISSADDLFRIATMGFRGEALPSIAAVSRLELTTKERGALAGVRILVEGGRVVRVAEAGAPDGTEVAVRDLFFNTPVRRRFLRTARTETSHIAAAVTWEALVRHGVGFTLVADGDEIIRAPAVPSPRDRIAALFGADVARDLLPVEGARGAVRASGFVSPPGVTRGNRTGQHFFVNGRPVEDRVLRFAVADACDGLVPAGRHPILFLFLEIEPHEVDVNVHPAKREVRFRNGALVRDLVRDAVAAALRAASPAAASRPPAYETREGGGVFDRVPGPSGVQEAMPLGEGRGEEPGRRLRILGQSGGLYIVCEGPDGLVIVDQHAAHERVLFERLMRGYAAGAGEVQRLLVPAVIELPPAERLAAEEYAHVLRALGIGIEPFGGSAVKVDQLPACIGTVDAARLMRDAVAALAAEGRGGAVREEMARVAARKVCRAAVKARDDLPAEALAALVDDLLRCERPGTCPHGRPTMITIPRGELDRRFGRA
ncbi:MAG: DNA mismatch repair endonuclease MutL [bacterium]|nr:DNA mismatch repair endonuclease MutL [bacterium]